jgi:hypothetical protein
MPLNRSKRTTIVTAEHVRGKTGLDGVPLPEPQGGWRPGTPSIS